MRLSDFPRSSRASVSNEHIRNMLSLTNLSNDQLLLGNDQKLVIDQTMGINTPGILLFQILIFDLNRTKPSTQNSRRM